MPLSEFICTNNLELVRCSRRQITDCDSLGSWWCNMDRFPSRFSQLPVPVLFPVFFKYPGTKDMEHEKWRRKKECKMVIMMILCKTFNDRKQSIFDLQKFCSFSLLYNSTHKSLRFTGRKFWGRKVRAIIVHKLSNGILKEIKLSFHSSEKIICF